MCIYSYQFTSLQNKQTHVTNINTRLYGWEKVGLLYIGNLKKANVSVFYKLTVQMYIITKMWKRVSEMSAYS